MDCPSIVNQKVCVEAGVRVEPETEIGDVHACCIGQPKFKKCGENDHGCTYMVSQMMCVTFPLTLSASACVNTTGIVCDMPEVTPCICSKAPLKPSPVDDEYDCPHETQCLNMPIHTGESYHTAKSQARPFWPAWPRFRFCFPPLFLSPFLGLRNPCK